MGMTGAGSRENPDNADGRARRARAAAARDLLKSTWTI
jgi:hypothetical protein